MDVEIMLIKINYGHKIILDIQFTPNVEGGTFRVKSMRQHFVWQPRGTVNHLTRQNGGVLYHISTALSFILWTPINWTYYRFDIYFKNIPKNKKYQIFNGHHGA